jgi:hypothetical protein
MILTDKVIKTILVVSTIGFTGCSVTDTTTQHLVQEETDDGISSTQEIDNTDTTQTGNIDTTDTNNTTQTGNTDTTDTNNTTQTGNIDTTDTNNTTQTGNTDTTDNTDTADTNKPQDNPNVALDVVNIINYKTKGKNLLSNGSFELGLTSGPIYVGWMQRKFSTDMTPPSKPVIDTTTAHSGSNSLKIAKIKKNHKVTLDFTAPDISSSSTSRIHFGVSAKSNCPNLILHFPATDKYLTTDWKRYSSYVDVASKKYPVRRFEVHNTTDKDCTIWLDDITWSLDESGKTKFIRSDSIEMGVVPHRKNGVNYANENVVFQLNIDSDKDYSNLGLEIHIRDLTRDGKDSTKYSEDITLAKGIVVNKSINLGKLPRGAYMVHAAVYDKVTKKILSTTRDRFTVLADLSKTPAPVNFLVGMHGGFHGFTHSREFSYRGAWDPDEYYETAYLIGLRAQRIYADASELTPQKGVYDLSILEPSIDYAAKHGCTTVLSVDPFRYLRNKNDAKPTGHDGDWIYTEGIDVSNRTGSNVFLATLPLDHFKTLFSKIGERFGDKLIGLENTNELNMYYHTDNMKEAGEDLFKPMYAAFKAKAPNVPVFVDFTMDFYVNYTDKFFKDGGAKYVDGFTYHPYGKDWVYYHDRYGDHFGIKFMKRNEKYRSDNSTDSKKLVMGMTELHAESVYSEIGWSMMQRTLLDWSGGALFSSGMLSGGMYFLETRKAGEYVDKSTTAPGIGSVALNAMYDVLGGYKLLKRVELDDGVLSVVFKSKSSYALAIMQGDFEQKRAIFDSNLPNDVKFFDQWGEEIDEPDMIKLSNEVLYIKSNSLDLVSAVENAKISWIDESNGYTYNPPLQQFSPGPDDQWYAELLKTGIRHRVTR